MLRRLPKTIDFVESADHWHDSRLLLPREGDLIIVEGGAIQTFRGSGRAVQIAAWVDVHYPRGTYFLVLNVTKHSDIIPFEKGSTWHVLNENRDRLLNIYFVRWRRVA